MKKIFFLTIAVATIFTSCKHEYENWYSETYEMSGEWHVTALQSVEEYEAIFGTGTMPNENNVENWTWDDLYETGFTTVYTYNSAKNSSDELIVEDNHTFWNYKVKAKSNVNDKTFSLSTTKNLLDENCNISIIKGKILKGASKANSGVATDSIVFYIKFSDDDYGFTYMKVSGFKKTGFLEDKP